MSFRRSVSHGMFFAALTMLMACEMPARPDFTSQQTLDLPLVAPDRLTFIGGQKAFIDTTKADLQNLFTDDASGLARLAVEEPVDVGDLSKALPTLDVPKVTTSFRVGSISLLQFSLNPSNPGGIQKVGLMKEFGMDPRLLQKGMQIPAGGTPEAVNFDLDIAHFVEAKIKGGALQLTLTNEMGVRIEYLELVLYSGTWRVGRVQYFQLGHGESQTKPMNIAPGTTLSSLNVDVNANWAAQTVSAAPKDIVFDVSASSSLHASEIVAALPSQVISRGGEMAIPVDEFVFSRPNDHIELSSGSLVFEKVTNGLDMPLDAFVVSFPDIRKAPFRPADSLVVRFEGSTALQANSTIRNRNVSLAGMRIYAPDNRVTYHMKAVTPDRQDLQGDQAVRLSEDDEVTGEMSIRQMEISQARGVIPTRYVNLNTDDASNGSRIDLFNPKEVTVTRIGGFSDLAKPMAGVSFPAATMTLRYNTNLGMDVRFVGAIAGVDDKGRIMYLTGKPGTSYRVPSGSGPTNLSAKASILQAEQLVQFDIMPSPSGSIASSAVTFDSDNSNVVEFLDHKPVEIRIVSTALVNPGNEHGTVSAPIVFEPSISVDVPLQVQTLNAAEFDTLIALDLSSLPDPNSATKLGAGTLEIEYTNAMPLQMALGMSFLDASKKELTSAPLASSESYLMDPASVDAKGFASSPKNGKVTVELNEYQMQQLYRTRHLGLRLGMKTPGGKRVSLRMSDALGYRIRARFVLNMEVN